MLTGVHTPLGHSHSISLLPFAVLGLSSRLTWHDFSYVTMAQKVPSSTLEYPRYPKRFFSEGFGDHMPVTPDPPSQPCAPTPKTDTAGARKKVSAPRLWDPSY